MYGMMTSFVKRCLDKRFAKRAGSFFVVAYCIASWKCPQTVPSLIDLKLFAPMKVQYQVRCQGNAKKRNALNKAPAKSSPKKNQRHKKEATADPPDNEIRIFIIAADEQAKLPAVKYFMPTDQGCYTNVTQTNKTILKIVPNTDIDSKVYKLDYINIPATSGASLNDEKENTEICKAIKLSSPGPHAILLCIPATEITNSTKYTDALKPLERKFGDEIYDFVIIALTRYNEIKHEGSNSMRKKQNLIDEFQHTIANNNALKKMENVLVKYIVLDTIRSEKEKKDILRQLMVIINTTRERRKEHEKYEFASCQSTKDAETELKKHMADEKIKGNKTSRDQVKKKFLDTTC